MIEAPSVSDEAYRLVGVVRTRTGDRVSLRHLKEYQSAVDDWGPGVTEPVSAEMTEDAVAPSLFVLAAGARVEPLWRLLPDGQYDNLTVPGITGRSVLASWSVENSTPVRVGDVVTIREVVDSIDVKEGRSGPLVIVKQRSTHTNQDGQLLATEVQTIIYR